MPGARFTLEPGYLLNARPYSDSSLLCEAFTRRQGRIGFIAKGARGAKSKIRALLQPMQALLLSWRESGELGSLTGVEAAAPPLALAGERIFYAWYLNELVQKLLQRNDAHPELFERYAEALEQLTGAGAEGALRIFEKHLLAETGYGLHLDVELDPTALYRYDANAGPQPGSEFLGASLIALRDESGLDARALSDARKLLRPLIAHQLGGKELETPKLLRQMRDTRYGIRDTEKQKS